MTNHYFKWIVLAIICCISSTIFATGSVNVTTFADLQTQFGLASSTGSPSTIVVTAAITVNADFNMTSATYPVTISIATTNAPITVTAGTLTIGNNVTISETKASAITVTGGNLIVNAGSIITNTVNPTILASGGNVTINGGIITCASTGTVTNIKITNGSICRITDGTITCSSSTGVNLIVIDDTGGPGGGKLYITGGVIQSTNASGTGAAIYLNASVVGQLWISGSPKISYLNTGSSISTSLGASRINIATSTANFTGNIKTSNNAVINNFANTSPISVNIPSGTYASTQTVTLSGGTDLVTQYTAATFTNTYAYLIANGTTPAGGVTLKYTTDGTDPTPSSLTYSSSLSIPTSTTLKVAPYILPQSTTVGVVTTFNYNIAPAWTTNYPAIGLQTTSGFTAKVNINEPGKSYYVVLPSGAAAPSPAQVKAGQNAAGAPLASNLKGTITCTAATTEYTSSITGLTAGTTYDVYFVADDGVSATQGSTTLVTASTFAASSVVDPTGVSSTVASQSQINVLFTPNASNNNVLIAYNTSNTFDTPINGTAYTIGNTLPGGGTIIYNGGTSPYNHISLSPNTTYYYKLWSVDGSNNYSTGVFANSTTYAAEPTTQASAITFSGVTLTGMTVSWTNGNGTNRLVLVKAGSAVDSNPVDGTGYIANNTFGSGTQIGTGNYVVYNSTGNSVAITGLSGSIVYNVAVYEYNGTTGTYNYLTSTMVTASQSSMMIAPAAPTALTFSSVTSTSFNASFIAPGTAPTGYLVLQKSNAAVSGTPVAGTVYTQGQTNIGSGTPANVVVYVGTTPWTNNNQSGLSDNTYYSYAVYSYNGSGVTTNYSTALSGSQITQAISAPISNASSNVTTTDFIANWSAVSGATGYSLDVNTTANFPFTENFQRCLLGTTTTSDGNDISSTVNNYMQSSGWSSSNIFQAGGSVRMGYTGALGDLITPTIDLSSNAGNATLTFDCNVYSTDGSATYQVWHAPDGKNFTQVGTDLTAPSSLTNVSFSISGGTASSKIKIATSTISKRILIDNIKIYQVNNIAGYDNLSVSGTSLDVTGLTPDINYYYRVRAVDANGTSVNSGIVSETVQSQTITFGTLSTVTYGDAPFTVSATGGGSVYPVTFTSSDPTVATCTGTNGSTVTILKAGSCTIYANQNGVLTYSPAPQVGQVLTINQKQLTITGLSGVNKVYDGTTTASVTGTSYSGLAYGETFSILGTPVANFADATVGNGKTITVTGYLAPSANYIINQPTGITANIYPTTSTWSGTGNWTTGGANWTYLPLAATDVVVANGELVIDQTPTVNSITVNPGAKLTLNNGITLNPGTFTLQSDPAGVLGTATFVDKSTATNPAPITATVQQYLAAGRNWYTSSPVTAATMNVFNSASRVDSYDEPSATFIPLNTGDPLIPMKGYVSVSTGNSGLITFSGTLNSQTLPITLSRTPGVTKEGFNLVGNPYPSYVNWDNATTTNLESTMWYRTQNTTGSYVFDTYGATAGQGTNNNGIADVTAYIPPMQAFWVRVADGQTTGSLAFANADRSHIDVSTNLFRAPSSEKSVQPVLRLKVSNGTNSDEAIVLFNQNATNGFDDYDSPKMTNANAAIPEIYTLAGTQQVVINGMNSMAPTDELPLGFTTGESNTFTIKATEISNFDANTSILLKDNLLNTQQDLTVDSTYSFTSDVASSATRFSLVFKSPAMTTGFSNETSQITVYKNANNQITVHCTGNINGNSYVTVSNAIGQKLVSKSVTSSITVIDSYLLPGVYLVTVNNAGKNSTKKVILN